MYRERGNFNKPGRFQGGNRPKQQRRHNPIPEGFSLFYIAIVCPAIVEEKVKQFKLYMEQQYGCRSALKSPAHLTIIPPFRAEDELEKPLLDFVQTFNMGMLPVDITLNGYSNFGDRVLFVDVAPNSSLTSLEKEATEEFNVQFPAIIFGMKPEFNPHVTIATRDIPEGKLFEAKAYFETNHPLNETFNAGELVLMKLVNGWWEICGQTN
ncbi:2'-5' RNA ligase family protein [soil metagenome]